MEIKFKHLIIIILFFIVVKVIFFYLTPAEWGDSYRFLKAGEYLSHFSYPLDEKRLPFFPLLLSLAFFLRMDALLWGRLLVLALSVLCLLLTYKLGKTILRDSNSSFKAVLITAFSPVFFYWTGKVYAEVLFTFLILLSFFLFFVKDAKSKNFWLGVICGLAFMTRFEGFFLFFAILLGIFFGREVKGVLVIKKLLSYLLGFSIISVPYFLFRLFALGTVSSSYFLEPSEFAFNVRFILSFFASLVFLFGFIPFLDLSSLRKKFDKKNLYAIFPILIFASLELLIAFIWQAAIPRLFVPIVPLLAIILVDHFTLHRGSFKSVISSLIFYAGMFAFFVIGRFYLRLPFLVSGKLVLVPVILSLAYVLFMLFRRKFYIYLLIFAGVFSSLSVAFFFKNVYRTIYQASVFSQNLDGKIAYSDETGVTGWYLQEGKGVFYDKDYSEDGEYEWLIENGVSYIIDTNEHNEGSKLEVFKNALYKDKFEIVNKFKSNIGIADTKTSIYRFKKQ